MPRAAAGLISGKTRVGVLFFHLLKGIGLSIQVSFSKRVQNRKR